MRAATLDKRIHKFIARKERQYPDLSQPVSQLTRELDARQTSSPLHTYAREVFKHDADQHFRTTHLSAFHYSS